MHRHVSSHFRAITFFAGLGFLLAATFAFAQEVRTWTDSTGAFSVKAKFKSETGGNVVIEQEDGQELEIPLDKLSPADQAYVKQQMASNPFQKKTPSPFEKRPATGMPRPAAASPAAPAASVPSGPVAVTALLQQAPSIDRFNSGNNWNVDVATLKGTRRSSSAGRPYTVPPKSDFFEKSSGVVFNPSMTHALLGYTLQRPGQRDSSTRLVLVDLKSRKSGPSMTAPDQLGPVALSDDQQTVIMRRADFGFGNADRLEAWRLSGSSVQKGQSWHPAEDKSGAARDVLMTELLDDNRLITATSGRIVCWDLQPLSIRWTCTASDNCHPALSPGRQHLAYVNGEQLSLINLQTEEVEATMTISATTHPKLAFSSGADRLAVVTHDGAGKIFDVATGQVSREFDAGLLPGLGLPVPPIFVNDDQVLFGHQYLVDLPSLIPLWQYQGAEAAVQGGDTVWFLAHQGNRETGVLFGAELPHPGVQDALEQAMADPNFFAVKPGSRIKLNLDGLPDAKERESIRETLIKQLESKELVVDPAGPVELIARIDPPASKTVTYHGFGGMQSVSFQEISSHLELQLDGKSLWKRTGTNQPFMVTYNQGQSLQDALKQHEKPNYDVFKQASLPRVLVRPDENRDTRTLGSSQVTTKGIR